MPREEINYQNTVIYKIQHTEKDDLLYVGHTTCFTKRKNAHKRNCNNSNSVKHNLKLYVMIRENGGWDEFKMLEIKKFPCNDSREACAEEDRIMKEMKADMNTNGAVFDFEKKKEYVKKYYELNKDQVKIYYENNKENKLMKVKQYREDHKEDINKWRTEIVQCDCGCFMTRKTRGLTKHIQSQRHKDGMKTFAPKIV